jgi:hypothetical protein
VGSSRKKSVKGLKQHSRNQKTSRKKRKSAKRTTTVQASSSQNEKIRGDSTCKMGPISCGSGCTRAILFCDFCAFCGCQFLSTRWTRMNKMAMMGTNEVSGSASAPQREITALLFLSVSEPLREIALFRCDALPGVDQYIGKLVNIDLIQVYADYRVAVVVRLTEESDVVR